MARGAGGSGGTAGVLADVVAGLGVKESFPLDMLLNDTQLITVGEGALCHEGRRRYIEPAPGTDSTAREPAGGEVAGGGGA